MALATDFIEAEGLVHLISPFGSEHTLCGDAFDAATERPGYEWRVTQKRSVTCPNCARVVFMCAGVRVRALTTHKEPV